jgi:hypothetical protein
MLRYSGPDPDAFLVWGGERVAVKMRIATASGRFP